MKKLSFPRQANVGLTQRGRILPNGNIRRVGQVPAGTDPWGRPWDVPSEGAWNLANPPPGANAMSPSSPLMQPNPRGPVCHPGSQKIVAETLTIPAGGSVTFSLSTPGIFCPNQIILSTPGLIGAEVLVTSIKVGLRDQIITGVVPGSFFGIANHCCVFGLFDCLCSPSVPLEVTISNPTGAPVDATVTAIGSYVDGCQVMPNLPPNPTKLAGFEVDVPISGTATVSVTTPGRFCPERLVLFGDLAGVTVSSIKVGTEDQLISGAVPAEIFGLDNECCIVTCFKCLCMPGYPMNLTFNNADDMAEADIFGVLVGSYADAC